MNSNEPRPKYNAQPSRKRYADIPEGTHPKTAWLVAPPCVGSTWTSLMLTELLEWHTFWPAPKGVWRRPQDVVYLKKMDRCLGNIFLQHTHTMWNGNTHNFVRECPCQVIIQTRDVYDNVVSTVDHLQKLDLGLPNAWVTDSFRGLAFELAAWHVIRYVLPWNLAFYVSWEHAFDQGQPVHFLDYQEACANTTSALGRVLAYLGESRSAEEVAQAIKIAADPRRTRYNVGKTGRGRQQLTEEQVEHIDVLLAGYRDPLAHRAFARISSRHNENAKQNKVEPHDGRRRLLVQEDGGGTKERKGTVHKNRAPGRLHRNAPGSPHHKGGS